MNVAPKNVCVPGFVEKLWEILQSTQDEGCLEWTDHGQSFIIKNKQTLCSSILPKYFKHSNLSSFVRQLNMYNFRKIRMSKHDNQFCHTLFRKNQKQLLIGIRRKPSEAQVEFGNQLICNLGLDKTPSNSETDDVIKKEAPSIDAPSEQQKAGSDSQNQSDRENDLLRYQNTLLWSHYCRSIQATNQALQKTYKFMTATYFNRSFNRTAPNPSGLNHLMAHLNSEDPSLTHEQYQSMVMGATVPTVYPLQPTSITNIILKKPCYQ